MTSEQVAAARAFRGLHQEGFLILANAWDASSARLIESLGARAIATTSAAVAWSHGYADGDVLPVPLLLATVRAIVRVIRVPLSVDAEGGYSDDPAAVGQTIAAILEAGAVGINIEDGTGTPDLLCAKVEEAKSAAQRLGVDLFVNARTDVYLRQLVPEARRLEETLERAARYREAGADGIFVPGLADSAGIRAVAAAVPLPLNVLAMPGLPVAAALASLGARRLSAGSGLARAALGRTAAVAAAFLRDGSSDSLTSEATPYAEMNALLGAR
jgi:2-methylisocitrate lyase-like PEP mutase family enzyme